MKKVEFASMRSEDTSRTFTKEYIETRIADQEKLILEQRKINESQRKAQKQYEKLYSEYVKKYL